MIVETVRGNGHIVISELVTDGHQEWLFTQQYIDYDQEEAEAMFKQTLRDEGLVPS